METPIKRSSTINPPVFYGSAALIAALVIFASIFPKSSQEFFGQVQGWIVENVSWFYILTLALILFATVFLAASRYGDIKLGPDHSEPDYKNASWFAMLFSAGMGIGLMFFGVAEPVMHFIAPPVGDPNTIEAAKEAMKLTFFHWGLHAWAVYAVVALILAFFSYRHGLPLTLRSALYPLIGERIYGPIGHAVDIFAVISTVLGIATSLGYGVLQINSGFNYLFDLPIGTNIQVILIISITALATLSVATGLDKGVKRLSELNHILAVILLYLGWWISWSPFVGMFIARVSRGRTIRQFVTGILLVPTGFTFMWMTVFGNTAIHLIMKEGMTSLAETVSADSSLALFAFLEHFPFSTFLSMVAVCMVILFFVTSADSGSLVIDMLASGGKTETPLWQRIFWASSTGVVAIALLLSGGLAALQTATIASALPFSVVLLIAIWGLFKALHIDSTKRELRHQSATHYSRQHKSTGGWQRRLRSMVMFPRRSHVNRFIDEVVLPGFEEVAVELRKQGYSVEVISDEKKRSKLEVQHNQEVNFIYEVRPRAYVQPDFIMPETTEADLEDREERKYFRAEVHLMEGGQDYDIMGWSREEVIDDILDQYEQHMHFLHVVR